MPELPEVEVVARNLRPFLHGKIIEKIEVNWPKIIKFPDDKELFTQALIGEHFGDIRRTGKYLRIEVGDELELVVHFRMTGKFLKMKPEDRFQKHIHLFFFFRESEEGLAYMDVRKFGDIFLVKKDNYQQIKGLFTAGVDPLSNAFTLAHFEGLLKHKKRRIKALLLDQSVITGLGNYICDEVLWFEGKKGVHPERLASSLTKKEREGIYKRIFSVIDGAIERNGNTFRDFSYGEGLKGDFSQMLKVYGRTGKPCFNCHTPIERIIVGGRSTHFCPKCQK